MPRILIAGHEGHNSDNTIEKDVIEVGRGPGNDIILSNDSVSRKHFRMERDGASWKLIHCSTSTFTLLNDAKVEAEAPLQDNDVIQFGEFSARFCVLESEKSARKATARIQPKAKTDTSPVKVQAAAITTPLQSAKTVPLTKPPGPPVRPPSPAGAPARPPGPPGIRPEGTVPKPGPPQVIRPGVPGPPRPPLPVPRPPPQP